jgi:hypothetical protein
MKAQTFKRRPGAMIGHAVAMLSAEFGEIILVAPTRAAAVKAAEGLGIPEVNLKEVKRVAVTAERAQVSPPALNQDNGGSNG